MTLDARKVLTRGPLLVIVSLICIFWSIPTFGVLLSSFRSEQDINETGVVVGIQLRARESGLRRADP